MSEQERNAEAVAPSSDEVRARLHAAREAKGKGPVDCWACEAFGEVISLLWEMHQAGYEQGLQAAIEGGSLRAENAMLRACRDAEQRALRAALPIVAAATEGPRLWVEPDGFGEPTIWHELAGAPQPVLAKSDLCVGSRHLWETVVARLTAGSEP